MEPVGTQEHLSGTLQSAKRGPGQRHLDWDVADPSSQALEGMQQIVPVIDVRLQALWDRIRDRAQ